MKKYKKVISTVLGLAMVFSLTACGNTQTGTTAQTTETNTTEPAAQSTTEADTEQGNGDEIHISYSYWGTPDEAASVQEVADKYHEENPGIVVDIVCIPNEEYVTKLNTMAAANELPDCGIMSEAGVLDFGSKGQIGRAHV